MISLLQYPLAIIAIVLLLEAVTLARILLRPHRDPASRIAWLMVVTLFPLVGIFAYLLLGEVSIGGRRVARLRAVVAALPPVPGADARAAPGFAAHVPESYRHLFQLGHSISGFAPVAGNSGRLLADSNATIDALVADIDAATVVVGDDLAIKFADNGRQGTIQVLVVADRDVDDAADADPAQLHRGAQVQAADRLVEIDDELLGLVEETHATEGQEGQDADGEGTDHKRSKDGWADLGLHRLGSLGWTGGFDKSNLMARRSSPR